MKYSMEGAETDRLRFRLLSESDFDLWLPFFNHPDSSKYLGIEKGKSPNDQCREWFEKTFFRYKNDLGVMNALVEKASDKLVGFAGLLVQEVDGIKELEVAYSILPEFRNKGFAGEAAIKCREFAFENGFADSIISIIHIDNLKSEKVALKNGMTKEKETVFKEMPVNIFRINKFGR